MKRITYIAVGLFMFALTFSCDRVVNTAEPSSITYLPLMELQGDSYVFVACGEAYTDAGVMVTEGGNPISYDTDITGSYFGGTSVDGADYYVVSYSAVNVDGIPGSAFREVVVEPCNSGAADDIAGLYTSDVLRDNGEGYTVSDIYIVKTGDNTYALSDLVGGFYDLGRGYGSGYSCQGAIITVNDITTNDITVSQGQFPIWGNTVDVTSIVVNADGTITIDVLADFGGVWTMTLTRQ